MSCGRSVAVTSLPTSSAPSPRRARWGSRRSTSTSSTARRGGRRPFTRDVIAGGGGESPAGGERTLQGVMALAPPHLSAYALTVEAGTPLADDPARFPDDDVQADEYEVADELLSAAGLAN